MMTTTTTTKTTAEVPAPVLQPHRRGRPSAIWIVPIVAMLAGVALGVRAYFRVGPTIEITFNNADGLEAGKSDVRYKNVVVGHVEHLDIAEDRQHIVAGVKMFRGASGLVMKDAKFWVERPRVGVGGISGLGTLLSGAYIGVDVGTSKEKADQFTGLEKPPGVTSDMHGTKFRLTAVDAGSLSAFSPVYLRRFTVGQVSEVELQPDGKHVSIEVFIQSPYDKTVTDKTVFWNASGVDVSLDASGLRLDTQSLATVVAGGISFGVRDEAVPGTPANADATFPLYNDRGLAMIPPDGVRVTTTMRFHEALRGVAVGTVIDFQGVVLGTVDQIQPGYDPVTHEFFADVRARVYPERLGDAYKALIVEGSHVGKTGTQMLQALVGRGLRAQIRSGNLITGSAYIGLSWFQNDKSALPAETNDVWIIPTVHGGVDALQDEVQSIVRKIDKIPFDAIGQDVHNATQSATSLMGKLDHDVVPDAQKMFAQAQLAMGAMKEGLTALRDNVAAPDSPIQQTTRATLEQVERAAYSLRTLSDYITQHPESLVRGRASGQEPK